MTFYSEMAGVANELLTEFGQRVILQSTTRSPYDPVTGLAAADVFTESSSVGAAFDFSAAMSGVKFAAGTTIEAGDRQLLLSPIGLASPPGVGSVVLLNGRAETWRVVATKTLDPSGAAPVLYECLLRR